MFNTLCHSATLGILFQSLKTSSRRDIFRMCFGAKRPSQSSTAIRSRPVRHKNSRPMAAEDRHHGRRMSWDKKRGTFTNKQYGLSQETIYTVYNMQYMPECLTNTTGYRKGCLILFFLQWPPQFQSNPNETTHCSCGFFRRLPIQQAIIKC